MYLVMVWIRNGMIRQMPLEFEDRRDATEAARALSASRDIEKTVLFRRGGDGESESKMFRAGREVNA